MRSLTVFADELSIDAYKEALTPSPFTGFVIQFSFLHLISSNPYILGGRFILYFSSTLPFFTIFTVVFGEMADSFLDFLETQISIR